MKSDNIKRMILYVFASTGAVMFFLAFFHLFMEEQIISTVSILEIICANSVITAGLFLTHKIEFRFVILEYLLDVFFMMTVIVVSGIIFNWYSNIPVWIPVIIVIVIYILFNLLDIIRVHSDIKEINKLLQEFKDKDANAAS